MIVPASRAIAVTGVLLGGVLVSSCMTQRVRPAPSQAVLEAREARTEKVEACADIATVAPLRATFAFQTAELSDAGKENLDIALHWLACRPALGVTIEATSDQRGTEAEQAALAAQRRGVVADYLVGAGVQSARLAPGAPGAPGAPDAQASDRLVIRAEGQGW